VQRGGKQLARVWQRATKRSDARRALLLQCEQCARQALIERLRRVPEERGKNLAQIGAANFNLIGVQPTNVFAAVPEPA
jgi:hypothetical protein